MKVKKCKVTAKKSRIGFSCHNFLCEKTCAKLILGKIIFPQVIVFIQHKVSDLGELVLQKIKKKIVKKTIMFISMATNFSCRVNWT